MPIDYKNINDVIRYCIIINRGAKPGYECIVVKYDGKKRFKIVHKERRDLWDIPNCRVIYDPAVTKGE